MTSETDSVVATADAAGIKARLVRTGGERPRLDVLDGGSWHPAGTVRIVDGELVDYDGVALAAAGERADAVAAGGAGDEDEVLAALEEAMAGAESLATLLDEAEWRYASSPTQSDERAVGCDLWTADGKVLASCLWADGELDVDSDGCGVRAAGREVGLTRDAVEWPDEGDAMRAVWGEDEDEDEEEAAEAE